MERHKLFNRKQGEIEDLLDTYITDLKNIALQCVFKDLHDDLLKDIFSWNLCNNNHYIKEKIPQEMPKTLDDTIKIAKSLEMSKNQAKQLLSPESTTINILKKLNSHIKPNSPHRRSSTPSHSKHHRSSSSSSQRPRQQPLYHRSQSPSRTICRKCGQVHRYKCPAFGVQCKICHKRNHFAKMCTSNL